MNNNTNTPHSDKAAQRGEPSYVWRAGQQRRLDMLRQWSNEQLRGTVLENGCGLGQYLERLSEEANLAVGMDIEFERLLEAKQKNPNLVCAAGENLPFERGQFDAILSNEVIEHVVDDHEAVAEMARVLRVGGRMFVFCPNRGYPFETHGVYRKGEYHFGNKLFVNYLPDFWRDKLAPHVRVYTSRGLRALFECQPLRAVYHTVIFGGYDNIIQRRPALGKFLRGILQLLEKTPLRSLGLSQFWVLEKG